MTSAARGLACSAALLAAIAGGCSSSTVVPAPNAAAMPPPREYEARFALSAPTLDGSLDEDAWRRAPWSEDFVDIEGPGKPAPAYRTRVKILWDATYLYIGAELSEPDVWGSLRTHDEIVFHDNDFEAFIDPDGDGREYYELEVNALGTIFDLFLQRKYRDGGPAVHAWDAQGLITGISVQGSVNDPSNRDTGWTVEWAVPWSALRPPASPAIAALAPDQRDFGEALRNGAAPNAGDVWRINFSRVQWRHNYEHLQSDGRRASSLSASERAPTSGTSTSQRPDPYAKRKGLAEDNWVWSPQWVIDMHLPEFWGRVRFSK